MAIAISKKKGYTYEDYAKLPEGAPYQLIGGELVMVPAPIPYHQYVSGNIYDAIREFVKKNDLGQVYYLPIDVYFEEVETYQPDIIFISTERLNIIGEKRIEGAPDLVVEILSPASAYYDLRKKFRVYEKYGVKEYWIVDPEEKFIEIYQNEGGQFKLIQTKRATGNIKSVVLRDLKISLEKIF